MSKILVLAEKPSVGKEIARVLGCKKRGDGAIFGDKYIVTWALGHLVTLEDPEHYDKRYKHWALEYLPMIPDKMALKVIPETKKQFGVVKTLLRSDEVSELVIATDAGREGELVARWIIMKAGFKKPVKRLWISSQTDKAIKDGFENLRDGDEYLNLYNSAQARAEADWFVGLNVTRALTCKHNAQLSAGRVQTPTLALIVRREEEIKKFVSKNYYNLRADMGKFFVTYKDENDQSAIYDEDKVKMLAEKIKNGEFVISEVKKTKKTAPPPALYDLTELQRDANKQYGFSPKQTLSLMQALYERHKLLSYPRTDSRYITEDIVPTLPERLKAINLSEYSSFITDIRKNKKEIAASCVNNKKVSDHHAIIPTEEYSDLSALSADELKIYKMVVKRFITCFYESYEYSSIKAELVCYDEKFTARGRVILNMGWKAVNNIADEEEEGEQALPEFKKGDKYTCQGIQIKSLKTTPPDRYNEATLLSAMENPAKFIEDKKMKEFINSGLGTPATRADIIEKLFSSFYMEKRGKEIFPTAKGTQLINIVPPDLKEPLLTAKWESHLEDIKNGKTKKKDFIKDIKEYTKSMVSEVIKSDASYKHDNITGTRCPDCGKFMLEVTGKRGKMLVCQDRECGHRKNLTLITNARCPECHKQLELFGEGEKKTYICRCGFREKAESLDKKLKEQHSGASKKYVDKYLKNQNKKDKDESPLAEALRKALEGDK